MLGDKPIPLRIRQVQWYEILTWPENHEEAIRIELDKILMFHESLPNLQDIFKRGIKKNFEPSINMEDIFSLWLWYKSHSKLQFIASNYLTLPSWIIDKYLVLKTAFFSVLAPYKTYPSPIKAFLKE